jgi:hypothetical protein
MMTRSTPNPSAQDADIRARATSVVGRCLSRRPRRPPHDACIGGRDFRKVHEKQPRRHGMVTKSRARRVEIVLSAICGKVRRHPLSGGSRGALMARPVHPARPRKSREAKGNSDDEAEQTPGQAPGAEGELRGLLLPHQPALRTGPERAVLDVQTQRGRTAPAPAAAVRVPSGAPLARGLGVPIGAGAGGAALLTVPPLPLHIS